MIILGVDPGTLITGYGLIEADGRSLKTLEYDVIVNRNEQSMPSRLKEIYSRLCIVISSYHPDEFAIETAFYGRNAQSALKIGQARGVSILAAINNQIPASEYSPREIKKAVVGNGAASKDQVKFMVKSLLRLRETPKLFDATDALAVALCHHNRLSALRTNGKRSSRMKNWESFIKANPDRVLGSR